MTITTIAELTAENEQLKLQILGNAKLLAEQSAMILTLDAMLTDAGKPPAAFADCQLRPGRIQGANINLAEGQDEYHNLPVRRFVSPEGYITMESAWEFTDEQRAAIVAGAPLVLQLLTNRHPPVILAVGEHVDE